MQVEEPSHLGLAMELALQSVGRVVPLEVKVEVMCCAASDLAGDAATDVVTFGPKVLHGTQVDPSGLAFVYSDVSTVMTRPTKSMMTMVALKGFFARVGPLVFHESS